MWIHGVFTMKMFLLLSTIRVVCINEAKKKKYKMASLRLFNPLILKDIKNLFRGFYKMIF